ncbi:hypothetical protein [Georgenia sp. SUBG003]|uniref:hypothetical protein n=1 Tax=Georgenia sp. SUBG003 TaxID=1497974 RepID=UPI003AB2F8E2
MLLGHGGAGLVRVRGRVALLDEGPVDLERDSAGEGRTCGVVERQHVAVSHREPRVEGDVVDGGPLRGEAEQGVREAGQGVQLQRLDGAAAVQPGHQHPDPLSVEAQRTDPPRRGLQRGLRVSAGGAEACGPGRDGTHEPELDGGAPLGVELELRPALGGDHVARLGAEPLRDLVRHALRHRRRRHRRRGRSCRGPPTPTPR